MASTAAEIVWLRWLLQDMGVSLSMPTPMYCDNKSAIQIAHNSVFHERTKHIELDCHFVRHHFQQGTISLPFVSSTMQLADFFTKSHTLARFRFLLSKLSMLNTVTSAISLTSNPIFQSHTRHIEVDYHCVREKVIHKELEVDYISSKDQLADLLTKVPLFGFVTYSPSFPFFVSLSACGA
ncbi:unnamed protein product [Prunus armeniaca]